MLRPQITSRQIVLVDEMTFVPFIKSETRKIGAPPFQTALYARADLGLGNRISALDHARTAVRMAPGDEDFRSLLNSIEAGRQAYRQTRSSGYDFRSAICANPCLTCCAANMLLNCCLGGCGRFGLWC